MSKWYPLIENKRSLQELALTICEAAMNGHLDEEDVPEIYRVHRKYLANLRGHPTAGPQTPNSESAQISKLTVFVKLGKFNRFVLERQDDSNRVTDAIDLLNRTIFTWENILKRTARTTYEAMLRVARHQLNLKEWDTYWMPSEQIIILLNK